MVVHSFNPSTQEAEVDKSLEFEASLFNYRITCQLGLRRETLSQNTKQNLVAMVAYTHNPIT